MGVAITDLRNALKIYLPHGPEALIEGLSITNLVHGTSAVGHVHFPTKSKYFQGHFPGLPRLPFHIVQEAAHQVLQVAILSALSDEQRARLIPLCWQWELIWFSEPILPNEVLRMTGRIVKPQTPLILPPDSQGVKVIIGNCLGTKVTEEKTILKGSAYFSLALRDEIKSSGV